MFNSPNFFGPCILGCVVATLSFSIGAQTQGTNVQRFEGVGRTATANELKAWDIDVRPDFKGLPAGQGTVKRGEVVWDAQCASCHGTFGESNSVFTPLVGYTTKKDIETGRVATLVFGSNTPGRTTLMKAPYVSTLWDYINRAMPWNAPKTLSVSDVYAVTAYLLNLGDILPDDFTLSDRNIADVQKKMPNRFGMTTAHAMWPGNEFGESAGKATKPDVQGSNCMSNCKPQASIEAMISSSLPDYARNMHGNLAGQTRNFGVSRGADTAGPIGTTQQVVAAPAAEFKAPDLAAILSKNFCNACHAVETKLIGPSFKEIAAKNSAKTDALTYLTSKIRVGGAGVYGAIPMPAQSISEIEAKSIAQWILQGAAK
jgi:S-disulfanyl-L-cysteine oxidoreductase SoxD